VFSRRRYGVTVTQREDSPAGAQRAPLVPPTGTVARVRLLVPIGAALGGMIGLMLALGPEGRADVATFAAIYAVPGGIDAAVPAAVAILGLQPVPVILLVAYFDACLTLFWLWNLDHLVRFQRVDRMVARSRDRADALWERRAWLRIASGWGLAAFIFLPIPGTGSFSGIVIGKLIDLRPATIFLASLVGTGARVATLGLLTDALCQWLPCVDL